MTQKSILLEWQYDPTGRYEKLYNHPNVPSGTICRRNQYECPKCGIMIGYPMNHPFCQHNPKGENNFIICHQCGHKWNK